MGVKRPKMGKGEPVEELVEPRKISADDIENIQALAKELGFELTKPTDSNAPSPKLPNSPDAQVKLVDSVFRPTKSRMPEFTYLSRFQAHNLACFAMLEAACDPKMEAEDLHNIFRHSLYQHQRSVERWLAMQGISLAGVQAEDDQFDKDMKIGGV